MESLLTQTWPKVTLLYAFCTDLMRPTGGQVWDELCETLDIFRRQSHTFKNKPIFFPFIRLTRLYISSYFRFHRKFEKGKKNLSGLGRWLSWSNVCYNSIRTVVGSPESTWKAEQLGQLLVIPELRSQGQEMPWQAGKPDPQNLQDLRSARDLVSTKWKMIETPEVNFRYLHTQAQMWTHTCTDNMCPTLLNNMLIHMHIHIQTFSV